MMAKRTRDNWRHGGNGLWLPEHPGALVPRGMGRLPATVREWGGGCFAGCCEEPLCNCDCENCAPIEGQYINNAPCCWTVTVRNMKPADPLVCEDCECFNYTYYLSQDTGEGANPCLWRGRACNMCATDEITLEVIANGGTHKIVVTLGDHVWSREYESPPECCNISKHGLTLESSGDDCDATQSGCDISSGRIPWSPDAECATPCCNNCSDTLPKRLTVHVSGVELADPVVCTDCNCLNRHWCLQRSCGCTWKGSIHSVSHCVGGYIYVTLVYEDGEYILRANYGGTVWEKNYGGTKPDCSVFYKEELTLVSGDIQACDITAATMTVTAGTDDCVFQIAECDICTCGIVPDAFLVSITGAANGGCSDCDNINGSFLVPVTSNPCLFMPSGHNTLATLSCPMGPYPSEWRFLWIRLEKGFLPPNLALGYIVTLRMYSCGAVDVDPWTSCSPSCYDDNGKFIPGAPYHQDIEFHLYSISKFSCKDFDNTVLTGPIKEESTCCTDPSSPAAVCQSAFCDFTQAEVRITAVYL